ncbi:uncharacterized protein LOC111519465 isoform X2 [Drosophila willistoni]|uniref:uncharacterized protein LOC111519465 isoform X2 n=1 Tax=Drosophila willistoni TaxID=7260 RepID=UPI001F080713|nr:uncharacterized protein LOC111519465 isoform X2 [Drosophila willistoni]
MSYSFDCEKMHYNSNIHKLAGCAKKRTNSLTAHKRRASSLVTSRQALRVNASEFVPHSDTQDSPSTEESENEHYASDVCDYRYTTSADSQLLDVMKIGNTWRIAKVPPQLANGPYIPLLRHRLINAEAYGLIKDTNNFNYNNLLMQDLVQQLSKLNNLKDLEDLIKYRTD